MQYNPTEALERIDNDTDLLIMLIDVFIKECRNLAEELEVACRQSGVKSIAYFENSTAKLIALLNTCEAPLKDWAKKNRA